MIRILINTSLVKYRLVPKGNNSLKLISPSSYNSKPHHTLPITIQLNSPSNYPLIQLIFQLQTQAKPSKPSKTNNPKTLKLSNMQIN